MSNPPANAARQQRRCALQKYLRVRLTLEHEQPPPEKHPNQLSLDYLAPKGGGGLGGGGGGGGGGGEGFANRRDTHL